MTGVVGSKDRGARGQWRQVGPSLQQCDEAPCDQDHHHHRGDFHDPQGLLARLVNALSILPPEIDRNGYGECRSEVVDLRVAGVYRISKMLGKIGEESREILPCGH